MNEYTEIEIYRPHPRRRRHGRKSALHVAASSKAE